MIFINIMIVVLLALTGLFVCGILVLFIAAKKGITPDPDDRREMREWKKYQKAKKMDTERRKHRGKRAKKGCR